MYRFRRKMDGAKRNRKNKYMKRTNRKRDGWGEEVTAWRGRREGQGNRHCPLIMGGQLKRREEWKLRESLRGKDASLGKK